jgi:hypothetical protein
MPRVAGVVRAVLDLAGHHCKHDKTTGWIFNLSRAIGTNLAHLATLLTPSRPSSAESGLALRVICSTSGAWCPLYQATL